MEEHQSITEDHRLALERIQELEGWAEYTAEALHLNQRNERVKREMRERVLEKQDLREIQELSWSLRDRLHRVTAPLGLSPRLEKTIA